MWHTRIRLRESVMKIKEEKSVQEVGGYAFRKAIHDKHSLVFFFIGMSIILNLDTSLLTQKVFDVENFANITIFLYFGSLVPVVFLYLFLIEPDFLQLIISVWALAFSRLCKLFLAFLATGKSGRNLYLLFYTVNGLLRGIISLAATHVISRYFLNKSYLHFVNGGVMFSILVSGLQMATDAVIGTDTLENIRKQLIVAQLFNLACTIIGSVWISVVYVLYNKDEFFSKSLSGLAKTIIAINKFRYSRFYLSKVIILIVASVLRVAFHPVLLPYNMDVEYVYRLLGSIMFTVFEFVGRLASFAVDEYIDPSKKSKNADHHTFLFIQDIPMYLLFFYQIVACGLALYSTWTQKFGISNNPFIVGLITLSSGFIVGFTINRSFTGAQACLEYFSFLNSKKSIIKLAGVDAVPAGNIITDKVVSDTSNANDILSLFNYSFFAVGSIFSYIIQKLLKQHKDSAMFIIKSSRDRLDFNSVNSLSAKLKLI